MTRLTPKSFSASQYSGSSSAALPRCTPAVSRSPLSSALTPRSYSFAAFPGTLCVSLWNVTMPVGTTGRFTGGGDDGTSIHMYGPPEQSQTDMPPQLGLLFVCPITTTGAKNAATTKTIFLEY